MEGVNGSSQIGSMRAFVTNGGPHSPETLADITMFQLFSSNEENTSEIHGAIAKMHASVQTVIRSLLKVPTANKETIDKVFRIILRDLATSMENERGYHKE